MNAPSAVDLPDGLPFAQRNWAILAVVLGVTLAILDSVIANVALPTIADTLHASPSVSIWIINAYQLAIIASLLPLAAAGDLIGYRRIYLGGLLLFSIASLACSFADSLATLTFARVVQGFGAAGVMSVNSALTRIIYPRRMLGRGVALNASVVAVATAIGPSLAAGILSIGTWPWLFAINLPIGLVAAAIGMRALPGNQRGAGTFDYGSAALNALTFSLAFLVLGELTHNGDIRVGMVGLVLLLVVGWAFVRRQLSRPAPLLPIDLLRIPIFTLSIGTSICSFCAQMLAFVALPFYLQDVLGRTQVETGLLMTPWPLVIVVVSPFAGRLVERYPAGILCSIGAAVLGIGLALLALLPPSPHANDIMWRMAVCGLGFGFFQSPNNKALLSAAPRTRSGGASGMLSTARLTGQTLGASLVALFFAHSPAHGTTLALIAGALFSFAAAGFSVTRLRTAPPATGSLKETA